MHILYKVLYFLSRKRDALKMLAMYNDLCHVFIFCFAKMLHLLYLSFSFTKLLHCEHNLR